MVTFTALGFRESLWKAWWGRLRPTARPRSTPSRRSPRPHKRRLRFPAKGRAGCSRAASCWRRPAGAVQAELLAGGGVLVHDGRQIVAREAGRGGGWAAPRGAGRGGRSGAFFRPAARLGAKGILLAESGAEVRSVVDGKLAPAGFRADQVALAGEDLLLARSAEKRQLLGFGRAAGGRAERALPAPGRRPGAQGWRSWPTERGPTRWPTAAARSCWPPQPRERDEVRHRSPGRAQPRSTPRSGAPPRSRQVDRGRGSPRRRPAGWRGRAAGGDRGVFLLAAGGGSELLLRGDATGIALGDDGLLVAIDFCTGTETRHQLLRTARLLELVRRERPALRSFRRPRPQRARHRRHRRAPAGATRCSRFPADPRRRPRAFLRRRPTPSPAKRRARRCPATAAEVDAALRPTSATDSELSGRRRRPPGGDRRRGDCSARARSGWRRSAASRRRRAATASRPAKPFALGLDFGRGGGRLAGGE